MLINRRIIDFAPPCFGLDFAIGFDGVNDYFQEPTKSTLYNFAAGENVYIECFFIRASSNQAPLIATQNTTTGIINNIGFNFFISNITRFIFTTSNNNVVDIITNGIPLNVWTHLVVTRKNGVWQYYINGYLSSTIVNTPALANNEISNARANSGGLQIGTRRLLRLSEKFNGVISKVIIDNVVPSDAEILRRANEPCCIKKEEYKNTRGAWFFQEASGNLIDFSANGIDLLPISNPDYQEQGPCV